MARNKSCCDEPCPVECPLYVKDLAAFFDGKMVEYPDPKKKLPIITLIRCGSCKTILGRLLKE